MPDGTMPWIQAVKFSRQFFWGGFNTMRLTIRPYDSALIKTLTRAMEKVAANLTIGAGDCNPVFKNRLSVFRTNCGRMNTTAIVEMLTGLGEDPEFKTALTDQTWRDELGYQSITAEMFLRRGNRLMPVACHQGRYCLPDNKLQLMGDQTVVEYEDPSDLNIAQLFLAFCLLAILLKASFDDRSHRPVCNTLAMSALLVVMAGCFTSLLMGAQQAFVADPDCGTLLGM